MRHLQEINQEREQICERYLSGLNNTKILLPKVDNNVTTVWHQFVIRCEERDKLTDYLEQHEIGSSIHYPIPPHKSEAYKYLGICQGTLPITERYANEVLSLPLYNGMGIEQDEVIEIINKF